MFFLYSLMLFLLWPLVFLGFVWRYGLRRTFKGLGARFGGGRAKTGPGVVWIHAASVGEVRAVEPFLRALPQRFPGLRRGLTTTTIAGKELAEKLDLAEEVRLAPLDFAFCVRNLVSLWKPRAVVLVETELWPNWIRALHRQRVPVLLINGRISDRSVSAYFVLKFLWEPLLKGFARIGVQSPRNAARFVRLGADPDRVSITGNLKYDVPSPDLSRRPDVFRRYGFSELDKIWVCGSTHSGEEEVLANLFLSLRRKGHALKWVLAPRHRERTAEVSALLRKKGIDFVLRSRLSASPGPAPHDVLILDTVGELPEVYGLAAFAFVGGSLAPRGGQNPLEPARWEIPVLFGPHMSNFQEMADLFLEEKAALQVEDSVSLEEEISSLIQDPARARAMGQEARRVAESQRGAVEENLNLLEEALAT
jgi:3-deoxy-D-manno-octulosonic-acid transferase